MHSVSSAFAVKKSSTDAKIAKTPPAHEGNLKKIPQVKNSNEL